MTEMILVSLKFSRTEQTFVEHKRTVVKVKKVGRWLQCWGGALSFDARTLEGCKGNSTGFYHYKLERLPV